MEHLPRLRFSLDLLIAEAKRRAQQRRVLVAVAILLVAGLAAGLTLTFRSQGVGPSGGLRAGSGIVFAHIANPNVLGTLDGGGDIYVLRHGGQPKRLMSSRNPLNQPTWSPNGRLIAFAEIGCNGDPNCVGRPEEVYVANSDGSHQRELTFHSYLRSDDPSWSPDSRRIVFLRELTNYSRLAIVSIANGKPRLLDVHGLINHPVWGKAGIAYLSGSHRSSNPQFTIRVADPSTGRGSPFASPLPGYSFQLIAWSSRAKLAALEGSLEGTAQHVTVYSRTGRQVGGFQVPKQLTTCGLAWSPHGTRLLLTAYQRGQITPKTRQPIPQLYTVDPSGKHWQRLPLDLGLTSCNVNWR